MPEWNTAQAIGRLARSDALQVSALPPVATLARRQLIAEGILVGPTGQVDVYANSNRRSMVVLNQAHLETLGYHTFGYGRTSNADELSRCIVTVLRRAGLMPGAQSPAGDGSDPATRLAAGDVLELTPREDLEPLS